MLLTVLAHVLLLLDPIKSLSVLLVQELFELGLLLQSGDKCGALCVNPLLCTLDFLDFMHHCQDVLSGDRGTVFIAITAAWRSSSSV